MATLSVELYGYGQVMCFPIGYMGGQVKPLPGRSLTQTRLSYPVQAEPPDNNISSGLGHEIKGELLRPSGPRVRICNMKG